MILKKDLQTVFSPRQYMLSKDFEIYYYSGSHSYNVKSHSHEHYEFYFFLEGNVSIQIQGTEHLLKSGDMILIPPGVPHFATVLGPEPSYRRFVFWISQEYCSGLLQLSPVYMYLMQQVSVTKNYIFHYELLAFKTVQAKIFQLIEEIHSERFGKEAKIALCVNDLILHLNRTVYESQHPKTPHEEWNLYQNLLQFVDRKSVV